LIETAAAATASVIARTSAGEGGYGFSLTFSLTATSSCGDP
jgi:hypothetical protein